MVKRHLKLWSLLSALLLSLTIFTGCGTATTNSSSTSASAEVTPISVTYSAEDMDGSWNASTATNITLNGNSIAINGSGASSEGGILTIKNPGTYVISGTLTNGQVIINAGEEATVRLVLNGANINSSDNAAIYAKQAKKVILTLADTSNNTVQDGTTYNNSSSEDEPNAAIFSSCDLTINGSGYLSVKGNFNNGIGTKDDLIITGGNLKIASVNDGLRGRDSIAVNGGTFNITAGRDALQANNDEDADKGWISIDGGTFAITAGNDGIQAETVAQITGGNLSLTTGGGSANASTKSNGDAQPGWGQWDSAKASASTTQENSSSAKGVKSGSGTLISGGTISINSSDDSIHSNGAVLIQSGDISISSGDDGIHSDTSLTINGGSINIAKSYEGLEGANVIINNGTVHLIARDDGVNAAGGNDSSSQSGRPGQNNFSTDSSYFIRITGGYLSVDAGGDGIDANGALYFNGGTVLVNGPTNNGDGPIDYDSTCEVTGGILAIAGSSGMAQAPSTTSTQNSMLINYSSQQKAGTLVTLTDETGNPVLAFAPSKDYQSILISSPELAQGKTYTLLSGGTCSSQLIDGKYNNGTISGNTKLTNITISSTVTSISDNGSQITSGMGGGPGGAVQQGGPRLKS